MAGLTEFVHLHQHSEWSLLDGACRVRDMPVRAAELGMKALAITDHGAMHGVVDFYQACKKTGIQPIIGCEVYVAPRSRLEKEGQVDKDPYHFVLLARDRIGYRNLVRLVSRAQLEGFYYKPRVDRELLAEYHEGITALSACLGAEVPQLLLRERVQEATEAAAFFRDVYGSEHFFLELQDHGIPEQLSVNRHLVQMSRDLGIGLVATNDAHYLRKEDARAHDVLLCIQTAANLDSPKRLKFPTEEFYLKSPDEMAVLFAELPQALRNTLAVAEQCDVQFEFGNYLLPKFPLPEGHTAGSYLRQLCTERLPQRYTNPSPDVARQMNYELDLIDRLGFAGYLLIVWDYCDFARQNGIPVGPGRGSAAGSLVCYLLGITNIDPIRYKLIFERFLNPERVEMPDIDIDFCPDRRADVIDYVTQRYGADCVAQIAAFGTMGARGVIRDVGRTLGFAPAETDKIAKLVPDGVDVHLADALQPGAELAALVSKDERVKELVDVAQLLEGTPRHASVHAAGIVIAPEPLEDFVPLMRNKDGRPAIQFDMEQCKKLGLLKMDFLGLRNLTVIDDCRKRVEARYGRPLDLDNLPLDDEATFRMIAEGHTIGMFQFESAGYVDLVRRMRPSNIEDIIAAGALYRPGPMENIPLYVASKHGGAPVYPHPDLEPILKDTYGIMIYQEQVQQVAAKMGGFTLGEADMLRRAIGKKDTELMAKYQARFVEGCEKNGYTRALAEQVYAQIEKFAGYGFNRCLPADSVVVDAESGTRLTIGQIFADRLHPMVMALDARGRLVRRRVTDVLANGVQPLVQLVTQSGRTLRCTPNHRIMTPGGWQEAGKLQVGDCVAVPRCLDVGGLLRWPRERLVLTGRRIAGIDTRFLSDDRSAPGQHGRTGDAVLDAVSELASEDRMVVMAMIWAESGHIGIDPRTGQPEVYYKAGSERRARDLQHLLLRSGIGSMLQQPSNAERDPVYRLQVSQEDVIPFLRMMRPHLADAVAARADAILAMEHQPLLAVGGRETGFGGDAGCWAAVEPENRSDIFWDPVVSVILAGEEQTYDLTVSGLHNFVADDVVVHNSHSAAYGYITYQTAYLKTNYPVEYMAALLTSTAGGRTKKRDSTALYIAEARRLGIAVLPPDINESRADFTDLVDGSGSGTIRVGLGAVKNVGAGAVEAILASRESGGPVLGLADFCQRVDLRICNRRAIESLIRAGAFDSLGKERASLLEGLEGAMKVAQQAARGRSAGRRSIFDVAGQAPPPVPEELPDVPEFSSRERLAQEKEVLGLYISGHPLEALAEPLRLYTDSIQSLEDHYDGDRVTVGGMVSSVRRTTTRKGDPMAFLGLEDLTGQTEIVLFPDLYAKVDKDFLAADRIVMVRGKVSWRGDRPTEEEEGEGATVTVVAEEVLSFPPNEEAATSDFEARATPPSTPIASRSETRSTNVPEPGTRRFVVHVPSVRDELGVKLLAAVLEAHPGTLPVEVHFDAEGLSLLAGDAYRVDGSSALDADISTIPFAR